MIVCGAERREFHADARDVKKEATANSTHSLTYVLLAAREFVHICFSEAVSFINPHRRRLALSPRVFMCVLRERRERSHTDGMLRATAAAADGIELKCF
jgi:hypothetical protein